MKHEQKNLDARKALRRAAAFVFLLALLGGLFAASAEEAGAARIEDTLIIDTGLSASDAASQYIDRQMRAAGLQGRGTVVGSSFTGRAANLYQQLSKLFGEVAAGTRVSTEFVFEAKDVMDKVMFTKEDLGVTSITNTSGITDEARRKLSQAVNSQIIPVLRALMIDKPYDLYWYDKQGGVLFSYNYTKNSSSITLNGKLYIDMTIASEYCKDGNPYQADPQYGTAVQNAAANARAIVDTYAPLNDLDKLRAYRDKICELTDYNYAAVEAEDTPYGNPWQLIWVFDGDPDTKVVCEGYAKAFQYLCDLSVFQHPISVISVSGDSCNVQDGSGGGHMWNIVTMEDGKNYLVDVTNCDQTWSPAPLDDLFMAGYSDLTQEGYYLYTFGSTKLAYIYDEDLEELVGAARLAMSADAYQPSGQAEELTAFERTVAQGAAVSGPASIPQHGDYLIGVSFPEGTLETYFPAHPFIEIVCRAPGDAASVYAAGTINLYRDMGASERGGKDGVDRIWFSADAARTLSPGAYEFTVRSIRSDGETAVFEKTLPVTVTSAGAGESFSVVFDKTAFYRGEAITGKLVDSSGALYAGAVSEIEIVLSDDGGQTPTRKSTWTTDPDHRINYDSGRFSFPAGFVGTAHAGVSILADSVWHDAASVETISVSGAQTVIALALNQRETVTLPASDSQRFSFTPEQSGYYVFCSEGDCDTFAELLDADNRQLSAGDEEDGRNFAICCSLTAGSTYYLNVHRYTGSSDAFSVLVTAALPVESIPVAAVELAPGETARFALKARPIGKTNEKVWFVPVDNESCTVTEDGDVTAKAAGLTAVSVYADGDPSVTSQVFVLVHGPVETRATACADLQGRIHLYLSTYSADGGEISEVSMEISDAQGQLGFFNSVFSTGYGEIPNFRTSYRWASGIIALSVRVKDSHDVFPLNHTVEFIFTVDNIDELWGTETAYALSNTCLYRYGFVLSDPDYYLLDYEENTSAPSSFSVVFPAKQNACNAPDLVLPAGLTRIEAEAFCGVAARRVKLGENVAFLGANAFAGCANLESVYIPESCIEIDPAAFGTSTGVVIYGHESSMAQSFAALYGFPFVIVN